MPTTVPVPTAALGEQTPLPDIPTKTRGRLCDPNHPDVCIVGFLDRDCGEIPYRWFTVYPIDPHQFQGDYEGMSGKGLGFVSKT